MAAESRTCRYRLDAVDVIVWVDEMWLAFAKENGAAELTGEKVVGRSLWDFIAGGDTRKLFEEIHRRVRGSGVSAVLPFRCDSPSVERHMRMMISKEDGEQLLYQSVLLRVAPTRYMRLLDSNATHSEAYVTICSCCKRALLEPVGWIDVEDLSVRLRLFESPKAPHLRYAVCPECTALASNPGNGSAA